MSKTAYIDNNIIIDFEQKKISREILVDNIDKDITDFYYSHAHLQEAHEMGKLNPEKLPKRLVRRFQSITSLTNNKYFHLEIPSNIVHKYIQNPKDVYETITMLPFAQNLIKDMINTIDEEQKRQYRAALGIDSKRINNYSHQEVIQHINDKLAIFGGYSILGMIEKGFEMHPDGKNFGLHNKIAGLFEFLDMIGYWKDKYNEKSNYARLWDSNHTFFSAYCDYFITNDKRTRNKAKVIYEIYGIKTIAISSNGK